MSTPLLLGFALQGDLQPVHEIAVHQLQMLSQCDDAITLYISFMSSMDASNEHESPCCVNAIVFSRFGKRGGNAKTAHVRHSSELLRTSEISVRPFPRREGAGGPVERVGGGPPGQGGSVQAHLLEIFEVVQHVPGSPDNGGEGVLSPCRWEVPFPRGASSRAPFRSEPPPASTIPRR